MLADSVMPFHQDTSVLSHQRHQQQEGDAQGAYQTAMIHDHEWFMHTMSWCLGDEDVELKRDPQETDGRVRERLATSVSSLQVIGYVCLLCYT